MTPEECRQAAEKAKTNFWMSLLLFLGAAGLIGLGVVLGWTGVGLAIALAGGVLLMAAGAFLAHQGTKSKKELTRNPLCGQEALPGKGIGGLVSAAGEGGQTASAGEKASKEDSDAVACEKLMRETGRSAKELCDKYKAGQCCGYGGGGGGGDGKRNCTCSCGQGIRLTSCSGAAAEKACAILCRDKGKEICTKNWGASSAGYAECVCSFRKGTFDKTYKTCQKLTGLKEACASSDNNAYLDCVAQDGCAVPGDLMAKESGRQAYQDCLRGYLAPAKKGEAEYLCKGMPAANKASCACSLQNGKLSAGACLLPCGSSFYDPGTACCSKGSVLQDQIAGTDGKCQPACGGKVYDPKKGCCMSGKVYAGQLKQADGTCGCPLNGQISDKEGVCSCPENTLPAREQWWNLLGKKACRPACGGKVYDPKKGCCSNGKLEKGKIADERGACRPACGGTIYDPEQACCSGGKIKEGQVPAWWGLSCGCPKGRKADKDGNCACPEGQVGLKDGKGCGKKLESISIQGPSEPIVAGGPEVVFTAVLSPVDAAVELEWSVKREDLVASADRQREERAAVARIGLAAAGPAGLPPIGTIVGSSGRDVRFKPGPVGGRGVMSVLEKNSGERAQYSFANQDMECKILQFAPKHCIYDCAGTAIAVAVKDVKDCEATITKPSSAKGSPCEGPKQDNKKPCRVMAPPGVCQKWCCMATCSYKCPGDIAFTLLGPELPNPEPPCLLCPPLAIRNW
ncbi:MAG TPA: hypothetical protein DCM05_00455 [Elusimicrobia bacterium]|nr:hypothetical protein [Elusimicrobiota bacterium]